MSPNFNPILIRLFLSNTDGGERVILDPSPTFQGQLIKKMTSNPMC